MKLFSLALIAALVVGCTSPTFERAELRAYEDHPTKYGPHTDYANRDDIDALVVDPAKAEAFFDGLDTTVVSPETEAPGNAVNRALFLKPRGKDDLVVVMFMAGEGSDEQLVLWYRTSSVPEPEILHGASDDKSRVEGRWGHPSTYQVAEWTERRLDLWNEMMESASPMRDDGSCGN